MIIISPHGSNKTMFIIRLLHVKHEVEMITFDEVEY